MHVSIFQLSTTACTADSPTDKSDRSDIITKRRRRRSPATSLHTHTSQPFSRQKTSGPARPRIKCPAFTNHPINGVVVVFFAHLKYEPSVGRSLKCVHARIRSVSIFNITINERRQHRRCHRRRRHRWRHGDMAHGVASTRLTFANYRPIVRPPPPHLPAPHPIQNDGVVVAKRTPPPPPRSHVECNV